MLKKTFFFLLIPGLVLVFADVGKVFEFEPPRIVDGVVVMNGCRSARDGFAPMVAEKPVHLALPLGHEAVSFAVSYNGLTELSGEYHVKPYIPSFDISKGPHPETGKIRSAAYNTNAFLPEAKRSGWFTTQYKCGIPIFTTSLNPVQYNAVTGKIKYYTSIAISVQTQPAQRAALPVVCTPFTKSLLQTLVDNKEDVAAIPNTQKDEDDYEFLIITPETLKDSWNTFIDFNARRCMQTKVETIQYISSNSTGVDLQEKVRTFIKKQYTDHRIVYVILGGDVTSNANNIPYRKFHARMYDHHVSPDRYIDEENLKADMYYSTLDGDWKGSNSTYGLPGTEDMFWEVYTGRFPVDNTTDLTNMINKTIKYSEQPVIDEVMNLFLVGNFMWGDYGVDVYGGDYVEQFLGVCTEHGYTTHGWTASDWTIDRLYDKTGNWSVSQFRSKVNSLKPTWIDHMGHGNNTFSFNETNTGVTNSNYQNDGTNANYFVIVTSACYPGNFSYSDCLLEQFVKIENGAVACIGCSNSSWGDDDGTNGSTQRPYRYMHDAIANPAKRIHYLEMMHALSKEDQSDIVLNTDINTAPYFGSISYCCYETNVLGDPALSIWTTKPMTYTDLPDYTATATEFTMKTPPYSWVALLDENGDFITTQLTGYVYDADASFVVQDSTCKINDDLYKNYVANNPGKKIKVRIKAHNYLPYEKEVEVTTGIFADNSGTLPANYSIRSFGKFVRVSYTLTNEELITVSIYNSKGALVKELINSKQGAGNHSIDINSENFSNGIYYCKLNTVRDQSVKKFFITR